MPKRDTCFICLQYKKNKNVPVSLQLLQEDCCECNALVHIACIEEWYKKSLKCPICRTWVEIKQENMYDFPVPEEQEEEQSIERIVASQIVVSYRLNNLFYRMSSISRHMFVIYSVWFMFLGFILLLKSKPEPNEMI